jgi:hypothetical protein
MAQDSMKPSRSCGWYVLAVAAVVLMLTPRPGLAQFNAPDARTLCQPLEIHQGVPDEQACLKELAGVARRDGGLLTLKLANGKTKTISDDSACENSDQEASCVRYRLVGRIGDRQLIVLVEPYECPYTLLINRRTGEQTKLGGWPTLSPNKKRLVVTDTRDAGNCSPDYAVALFSLASDPPRLEWQFTPEGLEYYDVDAWNGENRVQLRAFGDIGKQVATDLKLTAQGWQLKRPNGELSSGVPAETNSPRSPPQPADAVAPVAPPCR